MKKWIGILVMLVMIFSLAACSGSSEEPEEVEEGFAVEEETEEESESEIANPWSEAATLEEAVKGAGLDSFSFEEGITLSLGEVRTETYRYMDGIVDIVAPVAAVDMTIRKGHIDAAAEEEDISGDYTEYKHEWTQNINGVEVKCFGNRDGEATKTIWTSGDYCYAILAFGAGGDEDFGLSADDLTALVNVIK